MSVPALPRRRSMRRGLSTRSLLSTAICWQRWRVMNAAESRPVASWSRAAVGWENISSRGGQNVRGTRLPDLQRRGCSANMVKETSRIGPRKRSFSHPSLDTAPPAMMPPIVVGGRGQCCLQHSKFAFVPVVTVRASPIRSAALVLCWCERRTGCRASIWGTIVRSVATGMRFWQGIVRSSDLIIESITAYGPLSAPASAIFRQTAATQLEAIELGWPNENPAFRQLFTSMLIPDGTSEQFRLFNEQIRLTTPPANGKRIIEAFWNADIRTEARNLRCPTLVLHSRQDGRIPFEQGRELAGMIPAARFVPLESRNHLIFETESAWKQVVEAINDFLPVSSGRSTAIVDELTSREREVLELVARVLANVELSARLKISEKTVRNHVSTILSKIGAVSRAQAVAIARDAGLGRSTAP